MKIYITYDVTTSMTLTVERDSIPTRITTSCLSQSPNKNVWFIDNQMDVAEVGWGNIKSAWRDSTPENTWVTDEDHMTNCTNEPQQETHESNPYLKHLFDFLCWAISQGPPWILAPQRSQTRYGLVFVQSAGFGPTKTRRDGSIPRPV